MPDQTFEDKTLNCGDCKQDWIFESGEQEFFQRKGFDTPKRCPACRQKNKERRAREGDGGGRDRR